MTEQKSPASAGLEGVVAAETRLSRVDGQGGRLIICGRDLEEIAGRLSYEETAALLWRTAGLIDISEAELKRQLGEARMTAFKQLPGLLDQCAANDLSILEGLRAGWSVLADGESGDHVKLVAAAPVIIAALHRQRQGQAPIAPDPAQGQVADFLAMLTGASASDQHAAALETYLITVSDHGMNASTFTARVVASTQAGLVSSAVAALCALKGPLHGGAPGPVLDMLDDAASASSKRAWVEAKLAAGERIMGFGHRIYRTRDPRADVLKQVVIGLRGHNARIAEAEALEQAVLSVLQDRYPDRRLDTNVEFYTALALEAVGLPRDLFTPAFALGRVLGWVAHVHEQTASGRIIRPASRYVGALPAHAPELAAAG